MNRLGPFLFVWNLFSTSAPPRRSAIKMGQETHSGGQGERMLAGLVANADVVMQALLLIAHGGQ